MARNKIKDIWERDKIAIVVAGSGLYLRALIEGFFSLPADNRIPITDNRTPTGTLYKKLTEIDPATANKLHPNDRMRIIRAIEVYELTGIQMSDLKTNREPFDCSPIYIGLNMHRDALYERIDKRVDKMIDNGLLDEVKKLVSIYSPELNALQTIGYKELVSYLLGAERKSCSGGDNEITLDQAISLIKRNTRRYAKRQLTWFKSIQGIHWIELPDPQTKCRAVVTLQIVDKCISLICENLSPISNL
ncbi:MAG: tRNA (adenosine(37)-N6)-dimethylallyltransferase MiaA [Candidatus Stahlbacteria bacterium]|nr:tRNA (adenosine(37)-N6)-dimethylallyltransferase MiaA [Candidatus Stahlbacteria bacterium]